MKLFEPPTTGRVSKRDHKKKRPGPSKMKQKDDQAQQVYSLRPMRSDDVEKRLIPAEKFWGVALQMYKEEWCVFEVWTFHRLSEAPQN